MIFINSPFPYAGCKFNLLEQLDQYIPSGERLFDVFGGSAVVGVNMSKKFNFVCITDILGDLISMHRSLQTDNPDDIIAKLKDL
jgi:site-specific DNA-adenine methylase